ncbi:DUF4124 domain-containing protein [Pantoea sp. 18069]|uniref:DUF4124 domain-containing protein n=1 Tax=Pantoea sp. 18069 TaxID=2681415 RepID=UPI001356760C|nr:DUF4124 domain-containing protein [Pantoea sp. 18069]
MRWILAAATIALTTLAMPTMAQVHKCKDASGRTIYADAPCAAGQSDELLERRRTQSEIDQERMQAAEANERRERAEADRQASRLFERQQGQAAPAASQAAVQDKASSLECKAATKDLAFVSNIRTLSQDEKRMRTNAAIARVNASCGSNTQLMQEPPQLIMGPANITHCAPGFCYDDQGGVYHQAGPDLMTGPNGRTCHRAGKRWNCN